MIDREYDPFGSFNAMKLLYQASSDGGFILSVELVSSIDRSAFPFTPVPDHND